MLKKISLILLCLFLFGVTKAGEAEEGLISYRSFATHTFGQQLTLQLDLVAERPIVEVGLFFRVPGYEDTFTIPFLVSPNKTNLTVTHLIQPNDFFLPPFGEIRYWWIVRDVDGESFMIPDEQYLYQDDRFEWREQSRDDVTVYWTGDDISLGQVALDHVANVMPKILNLIPIAEVEPIQIYIYPNITDLNSALRLTRYETVGAHAYPTLGVLLVTVPNRMTAQVDLGSGQQSIPHELSHVLLYQGMKVEYEHIPTWFDEGLATYFEERVNPNYESVLEAAILEQRTLSFASLCAEFPSSADPNFLLAYAQSYSFLDYIQDQYGNNGLRMMIDAFSDGADCESVGRRLWGLSLAELEADWLNYHQPRSNWEQFWTTQAIWVILIIFGCIFMVLLSVTPIGKKNES